MQQSHQTLIKSTNQKSHLKLLSFSPQQKIEFMQRQNRVKYKNNKNTSTNQLYKTYQVEHRINPEQQHVSVNKINNSRGYNSRLSQRAKSNFEVKNVTEKITSLNITQNHQYKSIIPKNSSLTKQSHFLPTSFTHTQYTSQKQQFHQISTQRIQNQKNLTFLSRTFCQSRKQQQKVKKEIVLLLQKKLQREEKERKKQQRIRAHNEWLQQQRNDNSTKKYMNHLMKYHAKKSLIQQNTHNAQLIRQRLLSASSITSIRSLTQQHQLKQRSRMMKFQRKENIEKAKERTISQAKNWSASVREGMARVYAKETGVESWRIERIDERTRMLVKTIQNSKRNVKIMHGVADSARQGDSIKLMKELNQTLQPRSVRTSRVSRTKK